MQVWWAAIAGPSTEALIAGLAAFGARDDVEALVAHSSDAEISGRLEADDDGHAALVFLHVDRTHGVARVRELAREIAIGASAPVRVCFSGVDERDGDVIPDYAAFDVDATGTTRSIQVDEADRFLREHPSVHTDPKEELWELLWAQLGDLAPVGWSVPAGEGFAFRGGPLVDDPRLAELLTAAHSAKNVERTKQLDGRTLLRMTLADGSRRLAFLTANEAQVFERLIHK